MVIAVGFDPCSGNLDVYDSVKKCVSEYIIQKLPPSDGENLINFFQLLTEKINEPIDCLCLPLDSTYSNSFRKNLIEVSKFFNIAKVRMIGFQHLQLIGAIHNYKSILENNKLFWILYFRKDCMMFNSWIFKCGIEWEFENAKLIKNINELQNLESLIQAKDLNPTIFVYYQNIEINEESISTLFSNCKEITFLRFVQSSYWAVQFARHELGQEERFEKYKTKSILERNIKITIEDDELIQSIPSQPLPIFKSMVINVDENEVLKIFENNVCTSAIKFEKKEWMELKELIDSNGIFEIIIGEHKVSRLPPFPLKSWDYKMPTSFHIPKKSTFYNRYLYAFGIDLGTTESCVAVIRTNGPDFVVLDSMKNSRTMPSFIAFDERHPKCGQIVVDRMRYKSEYSVYDTKRIMGRSYEKIIIDSLWPFAVLNANLGVEIEVETFEGKKFMTPEEIAAILLQNIKTTTEEYQGCKLSETVITVPSGFTEDQIVATAKAAKLAGFDKVNFLPEPVAAAFAYFTDKEFYNNSVIVICDCGGGTTDVCVAKVIDRKLEVLSYNGDPYLGGRDFDMLLFNHFETILKHKYQIDITESNRKYLLNKKCQDIKHNLSIFDKDWLDAENVGYFGDLFIDVSREEFENLALPLTLKIKNVILQSLFRAQMPQNLVNYVFQVGGGCRMPLLKKLLLEVFPDANHQCSIQPDWVVAQGAALYAYYLKANKPSDESPTENKNFLNTITKMFQKNKHGKDNENMPKKE